MGPFPHDPVLTAAVTSGSAVGPAGRRVWAPALMAAIIAGLLAWAAAEATTPFFPIPQPITDPHDRLHFGRANARFVAATRDAALAWGITGGLLGLALGVVGAAATARRRILPAATVGVLLGVALGASPTLVVFPAFWDYRILHSTVDEFWLSWATHTAAWAPVGLAGGLAGAVLGAAVYEMLGAFVLPYDAVASEPVPGTAYTRLIAALLVAVAAAAGATVAVYPRGIRATRSTVASPAPAESRIGEETSPDRAGDARGSRNAPVRYSSEDLPKNTGLSATPNDLNDHGADTARAEPA